MLFKNLKLLYINLFIVIFVYFNIPLFFILIFFLKHTYSAWRVSFEHLTFFTIYEEEEDDTGVHVDYDTDSTFYFSLIRGDFYLWYNCNFFFYFHGGNSILNDTDFLDIIVYKVFDYQNFKYSYKNSFYKVLYNNKNYYYLYEFNNIYLKRLNLKYNLNLLNLYTFNILNNSDTADKLNEKKKYIYTKRIKKYNNT